MFSKIFLQLLSILIIILPTSLYSSNKSMDENKATNSYELNLIAGGKHHGGASHHGSSHHGSKHASHKKSSRHTHSKGLYGTHSVKKSTSQHTHKNSLHHNIPKVSTDIHHGQPVIGLPGETFDNQPIEDVGPAQPGGVYMDTGPMPPTQETTPPTIIEVKPPANPEENPPKIIIRPPKSSSEKQTSEKYGPKNLFGMECEDAKAKLRSVQSQINSAARNYFEDINLLNVHADKYTAIFASKPSGHKETPEEQQEYDQVVYWTLKMESDKKEMDALYKQVESLNQAVIAACK